MAISSIQTSQPTAITSCMAHAHSNGRTCDQVQDAGETYSANTLESALTVTAPS